MNFGEYMTKSGTSQAWLARELGVSRSAISNWAKGQSQPRKDTIAKVLALFRERAALDLSNLFSNQNGIPRDQYGGTPYERALRRLQDEPLMGRYYLELESPSENITIRVHEKSWRWEIWVRSTKVAYGKDADKLIEMLRHQGQNETHSADVRLELFDFAERCSRAFGEAT